MRLNLVIQRHGLPIVRILWNTSQPSSLGQSGANSVVLLSSRSQNATYGSGGYTVAQLLEDVNDVVPLETADTSVGLNNEPCGQWGLEDYVVEVGGFECLHFMEVESLLRDGDEVVIRALQTGDLRVRRLSGRHQISWNGMHLIDGVPFGRPYLKRSSSSRPAIKIPPRKRRRTTLSGWHANPHKDAEDAEWENSGDDSNDEEVTFHSEGSVNSDQNTVVRYQDDEVQGSDSDVDTSDSNDEDLTEEIEGLKEDLSSTKLLGMTDLESSRSTRNPGRLSDLSRHPPIQRKLSGIHKAQSLSPTPQPCSDSVESASKANHSPKPPKNVRFIKEPQRETSSSTSTRSSGDEQLDSGESSSVSLSSSDESDASSNSSETSSLVSDSESNAEVVLKRGVKVSPPGQGSPKTKNSNRRTKLRRRLAKLKELGHLPPDADFAALRAWEVANGGGHPLAEVTGVTDLTESRNSQAREQSEFEARRQKLLQDLESGGVDVDTHSEKENIPPQYRKDSVSPPAEKSAADGETEPPAELTTDPVNEKQPGRKLTVDVESSRRLLFGSLGVKVPKTKEDEEATRQTLAGRSSQSQLDSRNRTEDADQPHHDIEENWQDKLVLKAAECFLDNIQLSTPPFPFKQRWDTEAQAIIRQRKGSKHNKKKRPQRARVSRDDESSGFDADYQNDNIELNYDDQPSSQAFSEGNDDDQERQSCASRFDADYQNDNTELNYDDQPSPQACSEGNDDNQERQSCEMDATFIGDLPLVPETLTHIPNLTHAPDLVEDEMRKGAIIAYKHLELSKSTNWQPKVSDYRVAVVECLLDSGSARVQLEKRYWDQPRPNSDENEGARRYGYSGLEMPGFDDGELEDDGFREVSFRDLIEPKLIRISEQARPAEVDEDGMNASLFDREDAIVDDYDMISLPDPPQPVNTEITVSPQTRNDISQIIRDAGFRSTIDSELLEPDFPPLEEQYQNTSRVELEAQGSDASSVVPSPTFGGFPSSPPDVGHYLEKSSGPGSPNSTAHLGTDQSTALQAEDDAISLSHPDEIITRQKSKVLHQSPKSIHDDADVETMSDKIMETGDSGLKSPTVVTHIDESPEPGLTQSTLLDQTDSLMERPLSPVSVLPSQEYQEVHSPASSMVPNPFFEKDNCDKEQTFEESHSHDFMDMDWIVDEEPVTDLPSLESILASNAPATDLVSKPQAPKRQRNALSSSPKQPTSDPPQVPKRQRKAPSSPRQPTSDPPQVPKRQRKGPSSPRQPTSDPPQVPKDHSSPRLPTCESPKPAMPDTSKIVDLTISSPPRSPGGSDKDFAKAQGLPQGPGWVQKSVPSRKMRTRSSTNGPGLRESGSPPRRGRGGRGRNSK